MTKYPLLLVAVALIVIFFAGCTSSAPDTTTNKIPKFNVGDVVSPISSKFNGVLIINYDPVTDVYIGRNVGYFPGDDEWTLIDATPKNHTRIALERVNPYKVDYIPDPSKLRQGPPV